MTAQILGNTGAKYPQQSLVSSTCAYCGVGCGVDISIQSGEPISLKGTPDHPANYGRLCVKGTHLLDTINTDTRIAWPSIEGKEVSWDTAIKHVADKFKNIISEHGPDAVAFYVSGQILTEDYYVANKLMKGYIGSANIDTNSRLCMSSAVAGYKRAFGEDVVPCDYNDLENTDLLILIGSNAAWTHPVLYQRIERAKLKNPNFKLVVIDPRKTASTVDADLHLALKPGSDAALFNGLLQYLNSHGLLNNNFIESHTNNFDVALNACTHWTLDKVSEFCDLDKNLVEEFFELYAENHKVISFYSMGINQSNSGVDKCNSIINCHLATGRLLYEGAGPFSITGQPNAMGGREVGGLANQLAAHLDIDNVEHQSKVKAFWGSPTIATYEGDKAVDMFNNVANGKIKAIWIMATNPMVSLPNRNKIKAALEKCDCVVVSDCVNTDTTKYADILLPSTTWGEKDGTVTNSERTISRQKGFLPKYSQSKHDWEVMCDVANSMGFDGFDFTHPSQIFAEWAKMTEVLNAGVRQLNLAPLVALEEQQYDALSPKRWPFDSHGNSTNVFKNNQFSTPNKKANFIAITPRLPEQEPTAEYPFTMNSGRSRDQWHTMTRTGLAPTLNTHQSFPFICVNTQKASELGIFEGDIIKVESSNGYVEAPVKLTDDVAKTHCFMPIHWNRTNSSKGNVSSLYESVTDPISGQPESKQTAVKLSKVEYNCFINIFSRSKNPDKKVIKALSNSAQFELPLQVSDAYWATSKKQRCQHTEIASTHSPNANFHKSIANQTGEWIFSNKLAYKVQALIVDDELQYLAFEFTERYDQLNRLPIEWIESLFDTSITSERLRAILSAQADADFKQGAVICTCHNVRAGTIKDKIEKGIKTVNELGKELKCGTNCGSCKPELQQMINASAIIETIELIP